jgi:hypothetical protein
MAVLLAQAGHFQRMRHALLEAGGGCLAERKRVDSFSNVGFSASGAHDSGKDRLASITIYETIAVLMNISRHEFCGLQGGWKATTVTLSPLVSDLAFFFPLGTHAYLGHSGYQGVL